MALEICLSIIIFYSILILRRTCHVKGTTCDELFKFNIYVRNLI